MSASPPAAGQVAPRRLSRRAYAAYAAGSVGTGGFGTVPGLLLLIFLTDQLGVTATLAGLVVLLPKLWDVVVNPVVGTRSDRTSSRWGPRVPWMVAGAVTLPVFFFLMFAVPATLSGGPAAAWVMVAFLLAATGYACFQVPYVALPAEITDSYRERTTLTAVRIVVLTLAILVFGAGAPLLVEAAGGGLGGYRLMALVAGLVLFVGFASAAFGLRRVPAVVKSESEGSWRDQLVAVKDSRDFRTLFAAYILQALATGAMLAAAPYVAEQILHSKGATTLLFLALVGPAVLVMPVWRAVAGRTGKQRGFVLASLVFLAAAVVLIATPWLPAIVIYVCVAFCGIGYAGMQMFPLAMLPDTIHADTLLTGRTRAGTFTGVWTAGETAGLAIGPAVFSVVLAIGGYVSSTAGVTVTQSSGAVTAIGVGFGLVSSVLVAASLPLIRRYALTEQRLQELEAAHPEADATA